MLFYHLFQYLSTNSFSFINKNVNFSRIYYSIIFHVAFDGLAADDPRGRRDAHRSIGVQPAPEFTVPTGIPSSPMCTNTQTGYPKAFRRSKMLSPKRRKPVKPRAFRGSTASTESFITRRGNRNGRRFTPRSRSRDKQETTWFELRVTTDLARNVSETIEAAEALRLLRTVIDKFPRSATYRTCKTG